MNCTIILYAVSGLYTAFSLVNRWEYGFSEGLKLTLIF